MEIEGKRYEFVIASDLNRDGIGLECTLAGAPTELLLEAFCHDPSGRLTFESFQGQLPLELVEVFVRMARQRLPPAS